MWLYCCCVQAISVISRKYDMKTHSCRQYSFFEGSQHLVLCWFFFFPLKLDSLSFIYKLRSSDEKIYIRMVAEDFTSKVSNLASLLFYSDLAYAFESVITCNVVTTENFGNHFFLDFHYNSSSLYRYYDKYERARQSEIWNHVRRIDYLCRFDNSLILKWL